MENNNIQNEITTSEIGYIAKLIDSEMSIIERMKIKKSTIYRIIGALTIYSITMILFVFCL
jgi:hypothetical protein